MTTRKTFSLPDDLVRALEREASSQGKPESAIVREGMQQYLASRTSSKLSLWVGKGRSGSSEPLDTERELLAILERKHPRAPARGRPSRKGKS